ncbi:hypothetical protein FRC19_002220, partial [Serendipita sp. 401]
MYLRISRATIVLRRAFLQARLSHSSMSSATTRPSTSSAIELPSNQHFSIGPDGQVFVDLTFISEPLGMPADKGYGWPKFEFDDKIGQDQRYTIVRKLGWGMHSSTWLVHDSVDKKYVAVKALTGYMTDLSNRKVTWEANALKKLSASPISPHCVQLLDQFIVTGSGSAGEHLCFVMPLYGGDVMSIFKANKKKPFPLPLVKRILLHILRGIAHAHSRGVIHTYLKSDNFFFESTLTSGDVDRCVRDDPPRRHPGEMSEDGIVSSAVSQPLPMISMDAALRATYVLGDFGCAADATIYNGHTITSPALRPPEVFLKGGWTPEADIWTFGCIIFELIIGRTLFAHRADEERNLDETES